MGLKTFEFAGGREEEWEGRTDAKILFVVEGCIIDKVKWTSTGVDLIFVSNSQLRAVKRFMQLKMTKKNCS